MKINFATSILAFALLLPVITADQPEGSGLDWEYSGSGDAEDENNYSNKDHKHISSNKGHPDLTHDRSKWPTFDSDVVLLPSHEGFLDNQDIYTAVVAGAVVGATLAIALATFLILKWQKMDVSNISGRRSKTADHFLTSREEYVV